MSTPNDLVGGDAKISESETSNAKYLLIKVNDFATNPLTAVAATGNGAATPSASMSSFLRLGVVDPAIKSAYEAYAADPTNPLPTKDGEDLASLVLSFADDERLREGADHPYPNQSDYKQGTHPYPTADERATVSAKIHTLGGWRDHSDGNRVSTTRGDKVEVVRGNYKLLVLGRQDDSDNAAQWEASGGLIVDNDIAPGAIVDIRWIKDEFTGTWRVYEEATKGDIVTRYHGIVVDYYLGPLQKSVVGAEDGYQLDVSGLTDSQSASFTEAQRTSASAVDVATVTDASTGWTTPGAKKINPVIQENTWATSMEYQTGSEGKPVGRIVEKVWASKMASYTGSEGHEIDEIDEYVHVKKLHSELYADQIRETRVVYPGAGMGPGEFWGDYRGAARESWLGGFGEFFLGAHASLRIGVPSIEMTMAVGIECFLGAAFEIFLGSATEVSIGTKKEINIGTQTSYNIGNRTETGVIHSTNSVRESATSMNWAVNAISVLLG